MTTHYIRMLWKVTLIEICSLSQMQESHGMDGMSLLQTGREAILVSVISV